MLLEIKDLSYSYFASNESLHKLSCDFVTGMNVIIGDEGSSKTTLLKCIAGLNENTCCFLDGKLLDDDLRKREISMVFDDLALSKHRNLFYNIARPLRIRKESKENIETKVLEATRRVGLREYDLKETPFRLPKIWSVKAAIARLLTRQSKIYLLDNPLYGLPEKERKDAFIWLLGVLAYLDGIVIYATDSLWEAQAADANTLILNYGYKVDCGSMTRLATCDETLYVAKLFDPYCTLLSTIPDEQGNLKICDSLSLQSDKYRALCGIPCLALIPLNAVCLDTDGVAAVVRLIIRDNGVRIAYIELSDNVIVRSRCSEDTKVGDLVRVSFDIMRIKIYDEDSERLEGGL